MSDCQARVQVQGKYEEVLEEGRGPRVPRSKGSKVQGSQGPKDQDISNSHSNTSLTLKKVHLVQSQTAYVTAPYCSKYSKFLEGMKVVERCLERTQMNTQHKIHRIVTIPQVPTWLRYSHVNMILAKITQCWLTKGSETKQI